METERVSRRFSGIDAWEPDEILDALMEGQLTAVAAVRAALPAIESAAKAIEARLGEGGRLVYAGAGASGRIAVQDGAELTPTFSWPAERLLLLLAGGDQAFLRAVEDVEDSADHGTALVAKHGIGARDVVIAVAASGTTPFTLGCLAEARRRGALTIGIASNPGTPLLAGAEHPVLLDTGSEVIAGSTRMKAGTAQKMVLNMISTATMIRLGMTYSNWMINVTMTNRKLRERGAQILREVLGVNADEAARLVEASDGKLKLAVIMGTLGCDRKEAEKRLDAAEGNLRKVIGHLGTGRE